MALATALAFTLACGAANERHREEGTGENDAAIDALFASWDVPGSPGCALAVAQNGVPIYSRGYGYANLDYDLPITLGLGLIPFPVQFTFAVGEPIELGVPPSAADDASEVERLHRRVRDATRARKRAANHGDSGRRRAGYRHARRSPRT